MSAMDELIMDFDIDKPHSTRARHGMADNARAELAQLRADLQAARERIAELEAIVNKQNAVLLSIAEQEQPE